MTMMNLVLILMDATRYSICMYQVTYLLIPEKIRDLGSFFRMNSMILSSRLAVWAGSSGVEGNRARSSSASDTGQFNNSETR